MGWAGFRPQPNLFAAQPLQIAALVVDVVLHLSAEALGSVFNLASLT